MAMCMLKGEWGEAMRLAEEQRQGEEAEVYSGIVHFCRGKLAHSAEERVEHFSRALECFKDRHGLLSRYAEIEQTLARAELAEGEERAELLELAGDIFYELGEGRAHFYANAARRYAEAAEHCSSEENKARVLLKQGRANLMHAEASRAEYASFDLAEALECFKEAERLFREAGEDARLCAAFQAACYGRFIPLEPEGNRERFLRKMEALLEEALEGEALYEVCMLAGETYREVARVKKLRKRALAKALEMFERALSAALLHGTVEQVARSREAVAASLATLAHLERRRAVELLKRAAEEYGECMREFASVGDEASLARVSMNRGVVLRELAMLGHEPGSMLHRAIECFVRSAELFESLSYAEGVAGAKIACSLAYANLAAHEPEREDEYRRLSEQLSQEVEPLLDKLSPKFEVG